MLRRQKYSKPNSRWMSPSDHDMEAVRLHELAVAHRQSAALKRQNQQRRARLFYFLLGISTAVGGFVLYNKSQSYSLPTPVQPTTLQLITQNTSPLQLAYRVKTQVNGSRVLAVLLNEPLAYRQLRLSPISETQWEMEDLPSHVQDTETGKAYFFPLSVYKREEKLVLGLLSQAGDLVWFSVPSNLSLQGLLTAQKTLVGSPAAPNPQT